jgi:hypothetical protein
MNFKQLYFLNALAGNISKLTPEEYEYFNKVASKELSVRLADNVTEKLGSMVDRLAAIQIYEMED